MESENGRARAWVLVHSDDPKATSAALSDYFERGGDDFVVVRADVVDGEMNLIVPVDAANKGALRKAVGLIQEAEGVTEISVSTVLKHNPKPPHRASTFVTDEELNGPEGIGYYVPEFDPPGRHPKSPGANAWG